MDLFKQALLDQCDIKGLKCSCCNLSKNIRNLRKKMQRIARAKVARDTRQEIYLNHVLGEEEFY